MHTLRIGTAISELRTLGFDSPGPQPFCHISATPQNKWYTIYTTKGNNMEIKQGNYVKSVQSKYSIYKIIKVTDDSVFLKRVNGHLNGEYEVPKVTFTKYFHQAR